MSDSAAPKRRAFACSIALFRGEIGIMRAKMSILRPNRTTPTISTLFYISIHCHVSILSGILSRGIGFDVSVCYIAFWRVHLMGMFFIDRFEWGEVCICTLCAMKHEGGVSNGSRNAKSDGVHKNENAVKQRQWGQPRRQAKRGCDGVGYMRSHESGGTMDTK